MDNHSQVITLCDFCGRKRVYVDYHRLYNRCKKRFAKIQLDAFKLIEI